MLVIPIFMKLLIEFNLYFSGQKKYNQKLSVKEFIFWFILQIPYVIICGIGSFIAFMMPWKNRLLVK